MLAVDRCSSQVWLFKESMYLAKAMLPEGIEEKENWTGGEGAHWDDDCPLLFYLSSYIDLGLNVSLSFNIILHFY